MSLRKRSSENFRRPFVIEEGLGLQYQPMRMNLRHSHHCTHSHLHLSNQKNN